MKMPAKFFYQIRFLFPIFLFFLTFYCNDPIEEKCSHSCQFFVKCTEEAQKIKIEGEFLKQVSLQCIDGCTRFQSQILSCYDIESTSCSGMAECMKQSGLEE